MVSDVGSVYYKVLSYNEIFIYFIKISHFKYNCKNLIQLRSNPKSKNVPN